MFGFIIRPFRAIHRALGRTSIETRESVALSDTRKTLLSFRSACENSKAEVGKYTERVARLHVDLANELARLPEKRRWDWLRFDQNTLLTAIKDDLYEAEKKLHEELANYESNMANCSMFEAREKRLSESLEARKAQASLGVRAVRTLLAGHGTPEEHQAGFMSKFKDRGMVQRVPAGGVGIQAGGDISVAGDLFPDRRETIAQAAAQAVSRNADIDQHTKPAVQRQSPSEMGGLVTA